MGRKKKKSIEKTARKGIKKDLSQQLANQLQDVLNQFGDESKKSTKVIARATKSLASKLTPLAKIDKSVIKKAKQNEYPQEPRQEMVSNMAAQNSQSGISEPRTAAPTRARVNSSSAKGAPSLKTPMRKREQPKIATPVVSQNYNENRNDSASPPRSDQT